MGESFLLGDGWLEEAVDRLADKGWSTEEITDYVNLWVARTVAYVLYLAQEGYSSDQIVEIVHEAVGEAEYDLSRMPVVPHSK